VSATLNAFFRALRSQLHPKMLALLVVPFVVAILFWVVVAAVVWDPLIDWLRVELFEGSGVLRWIHGWTARFGASDLGGLASALVALMLIVPLMFVTALLLIALFAMPAVNRHLVGRAYRDVERRGRWSIAAGLWNAVSATAVFTVGYLLTMPLWLIPPLGFVVPWLFWGWLTARVMRFDSLVEFADPAERRTLIRRHRLDYLVLGLLVTVLNYVPPLFLLTPTLSALAFGHFSLDALRRSRAAPR